MVVWESILVLFTVLVRFYVLCDCNLSLDNDFGTPSPLYLQNGRSLVSKPDGAISLARSDTITVACPGARRRIVINNATTPYEDVEAHCIIKNTFRVDRWIGSFKDVRCNLQPSFAVEKTKTKCYGQRNVYRIGYKIRNTFYKLYEACFDKDLLSTLYVVHELDPRTRFRQTGPRPQFIETDLFGKVRMSSLFAKQNERIDELLGANMSQQYITKNQYLSRGHLAPRADFPMRAEQRASFHYVNTAPQWMRGNAGDWAALEDALRRRVRALGRSVLVYTGTHGVMTLADRAGRMTPFYLTVDNNNNGVVPVPMYLFKVAYDQKTKKATAFVTINSSFYDDEMIKKLTFCDDVCYGNSKFKWLSWRSNDGTFSFCCDYADFVDDVPFLPQINVTGLFY